MEKKQLQAFGGFVVGAGADQPYDFGQGFDIPFIRGHVIQGNAVVGAVSKAEGLRMVSFRTGQGKSPGAAFRHLELRRRCTDTE